jgi:hypothetical protein
MMPSWSLVYTVVTLAVFIIGWGVAYARGYSAGHDDGYANAVDDIQKARRR